MSSRLIENCFEDERQQDMEYSEFISIEISKNTIYVVVDPCMINIMNLIDTRPGKGILARARRPAWGNRFIHKIEV